MTLNMVTLTVDLADGQGNYLSTGTATLTPSTTLTDSTDHVIAGLSPLTVAFKAGNTPPTITLIATDNANVSPSGWAWTITPPAATGIAAFNFFLPFSGGSTQNLSALAPVTSAATMTSYLPLPTGTAAAGQVPVATGSGSISAWTSLNPGGYTYTDQGLLAQNFDVGLATGSGSAITTGTVYLARLRLWTPQTITNLLCATAGVTNAPTAAYMGLYNAAGQQVAITADRHTDAAFATGNNLETAPLTSTYPAAAGLYWVAILTVGTSPSLIVCRGQNSAVSGAVTNAGLVAGSGNLRAATYSTTGQSVLPGSFTPSSQMNSNASNLWVGMS